MSMNRLLYPRRGVAPRAGFLEWRRRLSLGQLNRWQRARKLAGRDPEAPRSKRGTRRP